MILNDDDELEPDAIEKLAGVFWESPAGGASGQVVLSWCPCKIQDCERRVRYVTGAGPYVEPGIDLVTGLFDGTRGPRFCGILMRTTAANEVGFSPRHGGIPDVGIWRCMAVRGGIACCVNEPLARYTAHNASCTGAATAQSWQRAGRGNCSRPTCGPAGKGRPRRDAAYSEESTKLHHRSIGDCPDAIDGVGAAGAYARQRNSSVHRNTS